MNFDFLIIPGKIAENLHIVWTFFLLIARFTGMIMFLPGIGGGVAGMAVRFPAVLVMAFAALSKSPTTPLPHDLVAMALQLGSEVALGMVIAMIPLLIINGVQAAGQLAGTTMGLQASQLIDPTLNLSISDVARIYGDLMIVVFLLVGGHYVAVLTAAGLGGTIVPGTFIPQEATLGVLIDRTAEIFRLGVVISAPIIVALMLTNFVMGLVTKMVPTVNIFIVSFPLTIGIGLIISILIIPEVYQVVYRHFTEYEQVIGKIVEDVKLIKST